MQPEFRRYGLDVAEHLHRALGLTDEEAADIEGILGREPNHLELAMYAVMWSEHCSYKSSRVHLKRLPTSAPWVLVGPGENAGVVDLGDGIAGALRIESHNHPSAIEPAQGAATGVGGILRDIFTMGARPIALMDPLRFGPLDDARSRWIAEGVVSGVSAYGNAVGVPTVGGEIVFDETYRGNPLVNVLCLGVLPTERLVLGQATGEGNLAVLLGSTTGRDGIGGVSVLASAGFSEGDEAKRPSVQVGDPFEEKRLIEACLELLDARLAVGIQDLGGAGLTCATSETASRGGMGMDVDVSAVPRREPAMEPFEVMTSESQERMLAIIEPAALTAVREICDRWEVRATVVGRVTAGGALRIIDGVSGVVLADVPASSLHDAAPLYHRPLATRDRSDQRHPDTIDSAAASGSITDDLLAMMADTSWVWSQYDHQLFLNTVAGPGGSATVLRLKHPVTGVDTGRGLALTTDGNHRWCATSPRRGTARVVAESLMNLACAGARPLALVNCLNFGNPEHPEVMAELSDAVDGMSEACVAFGVPVVGGNVSLYNESSGRDIDPTPVVGLLGVVDRLDAPPPGQGLFDGGRILLLGDASTRSLVGSRWAWERGARGGELPPDDLAAVAAAADLVRMLVVDGLVGAVHDVSDGGLAVALAEMAVAGRCGAQVTLAGTPVDLFGEAAGLVLVCVASPRLAEVQRAAAAAAVPLRFLGASGGSRLVIDGSIDLELVQLVAAWRDRLPDAFSAAATH
jgi:phosphoribosylformylglycinamidine synthase